MIGQRQNPPMSDPARIAMKLSLPIEAVRALQRRGFLVHFGLSDIEVGRGSGKPTGYGPRPASHLQALNDPTARVELRHD